MADRNIERTSDDCKATGLTRRKLLNSPITLAAGAWTIARTAEAFDGASLASELAKLENEAGGRLGVCVLDTESGEAVGHRLDDRFGMCSTFKLPLAGVILREVDAGRLDLDRFVSYDESDMVLYAPVTTENLARGGMTVGELARAAQTTSDNVAANLLLRLLDGPEGFTEILRSIGDSQTRLDRYEPEMNLVPEGEVRDTTTPRAIAETVAKFVIGDLLSESSRELLAHWTVETKTGRRRIRAGLPPSWRAGDKTGTGIADSMANKYNDVAIVWPLDRAPHVIAAYYEADAPYERMRDEDQAVLATVGRIAGGWITRTTPGRGTTESE